MIPLILLLISSLYSPLSFAQEEPSYSFKTKYTKDVSRNNKSHLKNSLLYPHKPSPSIHLDDLIDSTSNFKDVGEDDKSHHKEDGNFFNLKSLNSSFHSKGLLSQNLNFDFNTLNETEIIEHLHPKETNNEDITTNTSAEATLPSSYEKTFDDKVKKPLIKSDKETTHKLGVESNILLIPIGQTITLPFKAGGLLHISNGKLIKVREQNRKLLVTGIKTGELTITTNNNTHRAIVLDSQEISTYQKLQTLLQEYPSLYIQIHQERILLMGKLEHFEDWLHITQEIQKIRGRFILGAETSPDLQEEILKETQTQITQTNLSSPHLSLYPEAQALIPTPLKNETSRYYECLEPLGFRVIVDSKAISLEPMIEINVKMVELKKSSFRKLGMDLPLQYKAQVLPGQNFKIESENFDLALNMLEQEGSAKVIASPNLSCQSGKTAKFLAGGEFPIRIINYKSNDIQWKRHGILLDFEPLADRSGKMSIKFNAEISLLDQSQAVDGVPGLLVNRVESSLNLRESQTLAISGLIKEHIGKSNQGLAFLKKIPILGLLFSSEDFRNDRTDLVIFVTPKVIIN